MIIHDCNYCCYEYYHYHFIIAVIVIVIVIVSVIIIIIIVITMTIIIHMVDSLSWQFAILAKECLNEFNVPVYCSVCGIFNSL